MAAYHQGLDQIGIKHQGLWTSDAFRQYTTSSYAATSPLAAGFIRASMTQVCRWISVQLGPLIHYPNLGIPLSCTCGYTLSPHTSFPTLATLACSVTRVGA